jgi:hypothetical protein
MLRPAEGDGTDMMSLRSGIAFLGLCVAVSSATACAKSNNSGSGGGDASDEYTVGPGEGTEPSPDADISPPVQQSGNPASEADEGAPPLPEDAATTTPPADAGGG